MKATHATVTLKLVVPPGKTLAGMSISQLSFFASTGIVSLESMTSKERPATREETERNAGFLAEWELHLPEWEALNAKPGGLAATDRAANLAREMRVEAAATAETGAADPGADSGVGIQTATRSEQGCPHERRSFSETPSGENERVTCLDCGKTWLEELAQ